MGREIKFRFWDEENNRFWNGGDEGESIGEECFQTYFENHCLVGGMGEQVDVGFGECDLRVRELPKSQYTGLKDKNGLDIFESDIVRWYGVAKRTYIREIVFEKGTFHFGNIRDGMCDYMDFEVIGNIYQNSHLLTENQWRE